jgi:hypothetical protein
VPKEQSSSVITQSGVATQPTGIQLLIFLDFLASCEMSQTRSIQIQPSALDPSADS